MLVMPGISMHRHVVPGFIVVGRLEFQRINNKISLFYRF